MKKLASLLTNLCPPMTKCPISTNLLHFLKLCLLYCQKLFALAQTNCWLAEKIGLVGTLREAAAWLKDWKVPLQSPTQGNLVNKYKSATKKKLAVGKLLWKY